MFNFLITWKSLAKTWQQGGNILFFTLEIGKKNRVNENNVQMGWMIMAQQHGNSSHGFNDGHHWLSNGLSHGTIHVTNHYLANDLSLYPVFPQLTLSKLWAFNTYHVFWAEKFSPWPGLPAEQWGRQHQMRGIRVTKDWYFRQCFSIILNSTPMIFHSLWINCEFTIFDLQLNFLVIFDERKVFELCFLMQNPWHVT